MAHFLDLTDAFFGLAFLALALDLWLFDGDGLVDFFDFYDDLAGLALFLDGLRLLEAGEDLLRF